MALMRRAKMASIRPTLEPKWYWLAELFRWPASVPISRRDTPLIPRWAKRRSAVTMIRSRAFSLRGPVTTGAG